MQQARIDTVRTYLQHLHASNTDGLISVFEEEGVVHSPFLGTMKARDFFQKLAQSSLGSVITVIDIFVSVQSDANKACLAAHIHYDWTLKDGNVVDFSCVDVFTFVGNSTKIQDMRIMYDTHPIREKVGDKYAITTQ